MCESRGHDSVDEELSRRVGDEAGRNGGGQGLSQGGWDFRDQTEIFAEDLRKRARGVSPFEESAIEKIRALAGLRDEGIITEEEFQAQKKRLLDQV